MNLLKKMNSKIFRRTLNLLMFVLLFALMSVHFWGSLPHEIIGTLMLVLFVLHLMLNARWYLSIFKGRINLLKVFRSILNVALVVDTVCVFASGIALSHHVFAFLNIESGMSTARLVHLCATYWFFVLISLHIGLHVNGERLKKRKFSVAVLAAVSGYGIYAFIQRELFDYMFLRTMFPFMDFEESRLLFFADYLAMMILFISCSVIVKMIHKKLTSTEAKR